MKITICTVNIEVHEIVSELFEHVEDVEVKFASVTSEPADAIVSPANSFGIMDGGVDAVIADQIVGAERRVMQHIKEFRYGEINVGSAALVHVGHPSFKWIISAPTMRVPMGIRGTTNVYSAFRAMLICAIEARAIETISTPVFGTGVGKMDAKVAATQMLMAYRNVIEGKRYENFDDIRDTQIKLINHDYLNQ